MYQERMIGYYPKVIQVISEFQAIVDGEYPEFEDIRVGTQKITEDAYLTTMSEERIRQWEKALGIRPLYDSTLSDRRETIIARIRGQGKLNTEVINRIVNSFTGGTAHSWIRDGVLHVEINPPPENKDYKFPNLEQELALKVPAHLSLRVGRKYTLWSEVNESHSDWADIRTYYENWEDVINNKLRKVGQLDITVLDEFVLDRS